MPFKHLDFIALTRQIVRLLVCDHEAGGEFFDDLVARRDDIEDLGWMHSTNLDLRVRGRQANVLIHASSTDLMVTIENVIGVMCTGVLRVYVNKGEGVSCLITKDWHGFVEHDDYADIGAALNAVLEVLEVRWQQLIDAASDEHEKLVLIELRMAQLRHRRSNATLTVDEQAQIRRTLQSLEYLAKSISNLEDEGSVAEPTTPHDPEIEAAEQIAADFERQLAANPRAKLKG